MKVKNLAVYLNDHLAGSVSALELIDHLIDSKVNPDVEEFLKNLRYDVQKDQDVLKKLMRDLYISEQALKMTTAWFMEKIGRIKLHPSRETDLALLQSLEGLALGITGKKSLWRVLSSIRGEEPELKIFDFVELEKRAGDQCGCVEMKCLEIAINILK